MDLDINFFFEDIKEPALDYNKIKYWLSLLINNHEFELLELNYILCSDEYLLEINREHLNHDYYTDIITFDNSDQGNTVESDIFVSVERIEDNAKNLNQDLEKETHWVHKSLVSNSFSCLVIKSSIANLREGPAVSFKMSFFSPADKYTPFRDLGGEDGWYQIQDELGNVFWIYGGNIWKPTDIIQINF